MRTDNPHATLQFFSSSSAVSSILIVSGKSNAHKTSTLQRIYTHEDSFMGQGDTRVSLRVFEDTKSYSNHDPFTPTRSASLATHHHDFSPLQSSAQQ